MKRHALKLIVLVVLIIVGFIAFEYWSSDRLDDGVVAYKQGDYEKSFQILYPLSKLGNSAAQRIIGLSYAYGLGVQVNPDMAYDYLIKSEREPFDTFKEISEVYRVGNGTVKPDSGYYNYWDKRSREHHDE